MLYTAARVQGRSSWTASNTKDSANQGAAAISGSGDEGGMNSATDEDYDSESDSESESDEEGSYGLMDWVSPWGAPDRDHGLPAKPLGEPEDEVAIPVHPLQGSLSHRRDGGITARNKDGSKGDEIYFMGIIDILQQYNSTKRAEVTLASSLSLYVNIYTKTSHFISFSYFLDFLQKYESRHTRH